MKRFICFSVASLIMSTASLAQARALVSRAMSTIDNQHIIDKYDDGTVGIICLPPKEPQDMLPEGGVHSYHLLTHEGAAYATKIEALNLLGNLVCLYDLPEPQTSLDPEPEPEPTPITYIDINAVDFASNSGWAFDGNMMQTFDEGVLHEWGAGPVLKFDVSSLNGTYFLWVLGKGLNGNSDSIHFGLDGVYGGSLDWWELTAAGQGGWMGDTREGQRAILNLTGGQTLDIFAREDGMAIQTIILTNEEGFQP